MASAKFASTWGTEVPPNGAALVGIVCPRCGGPASMDRVSSRIYGWHDRCGWQASLRLVGTLLEPWEHGAR